MPEPLSTAPKPEKQTTRLEAFSDGVFAIAITLLALELKVPHIDGAEPSASALASALMREWPSYLAFLTSFFTVLVMWVHHHTIFKVVCRTDVKMLFINGLLLMLVTVVPFPTAAVAEYWRTPAAPAAVTLYCGIFVGIGTAFYLVLLSALRPSMLDPEASPESVARLRKSYALGPPAYLIATAVAPFSPTLAMAICTALWILWAVITREC